MRRLIEICLTVCEWKLDRRDKAAAWNLLQRTEKKTIWTFLSQGAVGGALGYFLLIVVAVVSYPSDYGIIYVPALPLILAVGAVVGSVVGVFVWLPGAILKRRLNFVFRCAIMLGVMASLTGASAYFTDQSVTEEWNWLLVAGCACLFYLPIVLMTGSNIRSCRLLVYGAYQRRGHQSLGTRLLIPFGLLLRGASIFGLLECLLLLVLWSSNRREGWSAFPQQAHVPAIVFAMLYFAGSAYLSFRTPRKIFLLPAAILLNLPLAAWTLSLGRLGTDLPTDGTTLLAYALLGFICLWALYTLGRVITTEPRAIDSLRKREVHLPQHGGYCVQL